MSDNRNSPELVKPTGFESLQSPADFVAVEAAIVVSRLQTMICRVELKHDDAEPQPLGTGFLIGPFHVLTNDHVYRKPDGQRHPHDKIQFRFDFLDDDKPSKVVRPDMTAPISCWAPFSKEERAGNPSPQDLDFTVARIAAPVGDERGWLSCATTPVSSGAPIIVPQHAGGARMQFATGMIVDSTDTRLHHSVNTIGGSSGSPLLDYKGRVVGLHCFGDPRRNVAIRMDQIISFAADANIPFVFRAPSLEVKEVTQIRCQELSVNKQPWWAPRSAPLQVRITLEITSSDTPVRGYCGAIYWGARAKGSIPQSLSQHIQTVPPDETAGGNDALSRTQSDEIVLAPFGTATVTHTIDLNSTANQGRRHHVAIYLMKGKLIEWHELSFTVTHDGIVKVCALEPRANPLVALLILYSLPASIPSSKLGWYIGIGGAGLFAGAVALTKVSQKPPDPIPLVHEPTATPITSAPTASASSHTGYDQPIPAPSTDTVHSAVTADKVAIPPAYTTLTVVEQCGAYRYRHATSVTITVDNISVGLNQPVKVTPGLHTFTVRPADPQLLTQTEQRVVGTGAPVDYTFCLECAHPPAPGDEGGCQ